jgi:hypothetical protein
VSAQWPPSLISTQLCLFPEGDCQRSGVRFLHSPHSTPSCHSGTVFLSRLHDHSNGVDATPLRSIHALLCPTNAGGVKGMKTARWDQECLRIDCLSFPRSNTGSHFQSHLLSFLIHSLTLLCRVRSVGSGLGSVGAPPSRCSEQIKEEKKERKSRS